MDDLHLLIGGSCKQRQVHVPEHRRQDVKKLVPFGGKPYADGPLVDLAGSFSTSPAVASLPISAVT